MSNETEKKRKKK